MQCIKITNIGGAMQETGKLSSCCLLWKERGCLEAVPIQELPDRKSDHRQIPCQECWALTYLTHLCKYSSKDLPHIKHPTNIQKNDTINKSQIVFGELLVWVIQVGFLHFSTFADLKGFLLLINNHL